MFTRCEPAKPAGAPEAPPPERRKPWRAFLEAYPEEALLRIRVGGHTVLLDRLTPAEVARARATPAGLDAVAAARLRAARNTAGAASSEPVADALFR